MTTPELLGLIFTIICGTMAFALMVYVAARKDDETGQGGPER